MIVKYLPGDDISSQSLLRNLFLVDIHGSTNLFSSLLGRIL